MGEIVWTTYISVKGHWEAHLELVFGDEWMHAIRPPQIEDFLRAKLNGRTAVGRQLPLGKPGAKNKLVRKTAKELLLTLGAIFTEAQRRELVRSNPCEHVSTAIVRREEKAEVAAFSEQEVHGLFIKCRSGTAFCWSFACIRA